MKRIICLASALLFVLASVSCGADGRETTRLTTEIKDTGEQTTGPVAVTETETEAETIPLTPEEELKGKTALFAGDAFMAGADPEDTPDFIRQAAEVISFSDYKNASAEDAAVTDIPGRTTVASQLEAERGNGYDIIILGCGVTDAARAVDIGRVTAKSAEETSEEELDTSKFAGGFENLLMTAKKLFPDASVGCIIPPEISSVTGCVSDMRRFAAVMRAACVKWGVFTLDLTDEETELEYRPQTGYTAETNMNIYQNNGPEYAIDGDTSTLFWAAGAALENHSFTVDLGALSNVSSVRLIMGSEKYPKNYMHSAVIEYSSDKEEFTQLCELDKNDRETYNNESFTARYVRVRATAYDVEWPLITEFEIDAVPQDGKSRERALKYGEDDCGKLAGRTADFIYEIYNKKAVPSFEQGPGSCDVSAVLYDKKVIYYGDSVCDKSFHDDPSRTVYYSYAGRIRELYGTKTYNRGKNGASFSTARGLNTIIAQTKQDLTRKADMIVIEGGVNDAMDSAPVGVVSDMTADNFDASKLDKKTLAGGLEEVLYTLSANHPEAVIMFMILYKVDFNTGRCMDMTEYVDMIKALCDKWGVAYLDLYNDGWFNERFDVKSRLYTNDGLHPNAKGYDVLTPVLAEFMADTYTAAKNSE